MSEPREIIAGIIVGHNQLDQGCKAYNGRSEFSFCSEVADLLDGKTKAVVPYPYIIKFKKIIRPSNGSYKDQCKMVSHAAKQIGASFCINLHLNAFYSDVMGCEGLITEKSEHVAAVLASSFTEYLNVELGFKNRGTKFVLSGHRGFAMLETLRSAEIPACIVEPCFVSHENEESKKIIENPRLYAEAVSYAARDATISILNRLGEEAI